MRFKVNNSETIIDEIKNSCDIDNHPNQIKRQKSAMHKKCDPIELNYENKTAYFSGSGKENHIGQQRIHALVVIFLFVICLVNTFTVYGMN